MEDSKKDLVYDKEYRGHLIYGRNPRIEIRHKTTNEYYLMMKVEYNKRKCKFQIFLNSGAGPIGFQQYEFSEIEEIAKEAISLLKKEINKRDKIQNFSI